MALRTAETFDGATQKCDHFFISFLDYSTSINNFLWYSCPGSPIGKDKLGPLHPRKCPSGGSLPLKVRSIVWLFVHTGKSMKLHHL